MANSTFNSSRTILIVDDEPDIIEILSFNLETEGYNVITSDAPYNLTDKLPDLILLDVMMTPKSGFEWAKELKANPLTANIPIIFCTAKTTEEDLLTGFGLGSDDYICKPFRISEVKARVAAVLRRSTPTPIPNKQETVDSESRNIIIFTHDDLNSPSNKDDIEEKSLVLDLNRKECLVDGIEIAFTKLEFEIMALLLSSPGQVFSREKILQTVWPNDTIVLDRTVDVNITRIRKKIGRYGKFLRTKFGYGYLFEK